MNTNKGALIRSFDYSPLKTKQGEPSKKNAFSIVIASIESALNNKRNIQFFPHSHNAPPKKIQKHPACQLLGKPRALNVCIDPTTIDDNLINVTRPRESRIELK